MEKEQFLKRYASRFNAEQLEAVKAVEGPVLLLAVPGSGKTTVLVTRLGYMLHCLNISPDKILTLTYTVAATNDMHRRYESIFGDGSADEIEFRTINGICQKIIMKYARMLGKQSVYDVVDEKERVAILTKILAGKYEDYPTESDVKAAETWIAYCKNMLLTDDDIREIGDREDIPLLEVFTEYKQVLKQRLLMDYDDQMVYAYKMLTSSKKLLDWCRSNYEYICVDEAQDTSKVQHMIIGLLAGKDGNLFMVGDEDQSIYGFRAAYPEALLAFKEDHPGARVLIMNKNYRSNAKIVEAADRFIRHNMARYDKHMAATREPGTDISFVQLDRRSNQYGYLIKVAQDCRRETAVLYRENESALPLIDQLDRNGMEYRTNSGDNIAFFTNRVVVDVISFMRLAMDPCDTASFRRIVHKCKTFMRKNQVEETCAISEKEGITVFDAAERVDDINGMVLGKIRALATHLKNMLNEEPSKALYRIESPLGYGEYLDDNKVDTNKLTTLKMLSYNEKTIPGFLDRLQYLQNLLKEKKQNYDCKFILSTIHSSKGLEYDRVYLMDVCDGVFPNKTIMAAHRENPKDKNFEEERRMFYVAITRARNDLSIFTFKTRGESTLVNELNPPKQRKVPASPKARNGVVAIGESGAGNDIIQSYKSGIYTGAVNPGVAESNYELVIGERIIQEKFGSGTVTDVFYDKAGKLDKFEVTYDTGEQKQYIFPIAFVRSMRLESGEAVHIRYQK